MGEYGILTLKNDTKLKKVEKYIMDAHTFSDQSRNLID